MSFTYATKDNIVHSYSICKLYNRPYHLKNYYISRMYYSVHIDKEMILVRVTDLND
jgi:hypothetical protein